MRLKRLELQGFKSFVDRTILTFDDCITGVVGPNGCGKSNIVDAILWVMGEQSPKHLRGDSMTDVIFNGCESRQATSMAEVSLVLDRRGVALAPQFTSFLKGEEISITRRLFRDGTSEYLINKSKCRLKDIHELFMDTGVGRRAYSIIEQGQIDRMINVKPEDRRTLFEEVAGITKYKAKRKEADRKLESTRQNLLRLQDIINELEKRIRSLKVQATRARRYKELKSELETIDLYTLGRSLYGLRQEVERLQANKEELEVRRSELDARTAEVDAEVTQAEIRKVDQERALREHAEQERNLSLQIQRLESEINLLQERGKNLNQVSEQSLKEEAEIDETVTRLNRESQEFQNTWVELEENLESLSQAISELEGKITSLQDDKEQAEQRRDTVLFERKQISERAIRLQNQVEHGEQKEKECSEKRQELNDKLTQLVVSLDGHRTRLEEAETKVVDANQRCRQAEGDAQSLAQECVQASERLSDLEEALSSLRETFHAKRSRLESLKELQHNLEGYSPTAREVLLKLEGTPVQAHPLAEVLRPEADIEDHLEMFLGADINTLLVPSSEDAVQLARLIREKELEKVRILALSELPEEFSSSFEEIPGVVPVLSKIQVDPPYQAVAEHWFRGVYLCSDVEDLFSLRQRYPDRTFLTADNRTIAHGDRSLTSGILPSKTGVFARRREIDELKGECEELEEQLNTQKAERENLFQYLKEQEKLHAQTKDKLSSLQVEIVGFRKEKEKLQLECDQVDREYTGVLSDSERNLVQLDENRGLVENWRQELTGILGEEDILQTEQQGLVENIQNVTSELDEIHSSLSEKRIEHSRLKERREGLEYRQQKIQSDLALAESRKTNLGSQRSRDREELEDIQKSIAEVEVKKAEEENNRNQVVVLISETEQGFNETSSWINEIREQLTEFKKEREQLVSDIQNREVQLAQKDSDLDHLRATSVERYNQEVAELGENARIDVEKLPNFTKQLDVTFELLLPHEQQPLLDNYLSELRQKISRYGEVNLTAIQEFDEIQGRYDFLVEQRTDLEKSIGILEEAIQKIDLSTRTRFEETFHAVDKKFKEIFPILFNGGKAELKLTYAENVLDAGVDVMVQPPGKRLQSISLLSGGEKALTAVSLVLAIFARKPSPFCLLDEVDAPLDDANVSRFNTVITKMAEKTQFIVITHNKKTMEITESLYGVTMEKPGISRMASVSVH